MSLSDRAARLFQQHRDELGFVNTAQCEEKDLVTIQKDGVVVGALLGNHCVRKPQSTVYELAVLSDYRREGIASQLVSQFVDESPHNKLVAKCPVTLPANEFYESTGWTLADTDEGKNRPLNVWEYQVPRAVEVYMTAKGGKEQANAVRNSDAYVGFESGSSWPYDDSAEFVDYPFTDPNATFDEHLSVVKKHEPKLTVAPDVEKGTTIEESVEMADELAEYADNVIIVPKECHPSEIPDRHRVGLTVGSFGSMAPWGLWEYRDVGGVHILGGTPAEQLSVGWHGIDVASVDSFTLGVRARYGMWDGKAVDAPDGMDYYERLTESLNNYVAAWEDVDV